MTSLLFSPHRLGRLSLPNRVVMAPMTRSRALGNVPNELMAAYYAQRAEAGLIVTEGTAPAPDGLGYARIPGCYSDDQVAGWRRVTDAVHAAGGRIFVQLMHTGRVGHPANLPPGAEIVGPSALAAPGEMYTDAEGSRPHPTPRAMEPADIRRAIDGFVHASRRAIEAGFDGVELHGANGYLIEQFLSPAANRREDAYGGSIENRNRFAVEVAGAVAAAIGGERTGIRLSPYGVFNGISIHDELDAQYETLVRGLDGAGLVYVHLVDHEAMGTPPVPMALKRSVRAAFTGTVILSGGYDRARADADLSSGLGDLVAFGRPYLANPDLVRRLKHGGALAAPNRATFYTPGPEGYTDYPSLELPA